ncbi:hypothetical protein, partial [Nonomuraea sp. NPDC002799]
MRALRGLLTATMILALTPAVAARADEPPEPAKIVQEQPKSEESAVAAARRTGQPVEIESMRSETRQVFAKPDGT